MAPNDPIDLVSTEAEVELERVWQNPKDKQPFHLATILPAVRTGIIGPEVKTSEIPSLRQVGGAHG